MKVLDFGKNKGLILADCDEKYLKWLVSHEKVLAERNRWASRDAKILLEKIVEPSIYAQILLERINNTQKNIMFAQYEYKRKEFQAQLENSLSFMKSEYGHELKIKYNEYIFA